MNTHDISEYDRYLFHEGKHYDSYKFLGAHLEKNGVRFTVFAKNATTVSVVGDFNNWDTKKNPMNKIDNEGIWTTFIPEAKEGDSYKFFITNENAYFKKEFYKSDPYAFFAKVRPETDSVIFDISKYKWNDKKYLEKRAKKNLLEEPINIYEVNLASWKYGENGRWYNYEELADLLIPYLKEHHFTHIELMPIMEHPYDGSWGYQVTGFYAVTSRYGNPIQFKKFVDKFHCEGIGVILDWVPSHFCKDEHGLAYFDGEPLYESKDPVYRENKEWDTMNFDYNSPQVNSFLISNANFYIEEYHIDGIRVDAVSYMTHKGMRTGRHDLFDSREIDNSSIEFIKRLNTEVFRRKEDILMIAEDSSAYPNVTMPVHASGLGFNLKWNMGWMHDTLEYFSSDPIYRKKMQDRITFSIFYAFNENFLLPFSHDEVVHGKKSLIEKMPGDYWQKFANLRTLLSYQFFHPGKKLNFMGNEFAQFIEWNEWKQLDWFLDQYESHKKFQYFFKTLGKIYKENKSLYEVDFKHQGFEWILLDRYEDSVLAFKRIAKDGESVVAILNFTPVKREYYPVPFKEPLSFKLLLNSDDEAFGGSGVFIPEYLKTVSKSDSDTSKNELNKNPLKDQQGEENNLIFTLPPLSAILLKPYKE